MTYAPEFLAFVNGSPTPYHAVSNAVKVLEQEGYTELCERDAWDVKPGSRHFVVRNGSSLIAFAAGGKWKPGNGFAMVGAHTDSPCLRIKPNSARTAQGHFDQVGVEIYGGGLWPTWFDRDLGVAGRVFVKSGSGITARLVHVTRPILRIPTLAIHLAREQSQKLEFNKEDHLRPILGLALGGSVDCSTDSDESRAGAPVLSLRHNVGLLAEVAKELDVESSAIVDFELVLFDTQPAVVGGLSNEFIFGPRQDNLNQSWCALKALVTAQNQEKNDVVQAIALFDHEEIGSMSRQGAFSNFLESVISSVSPGHDSAATYKVLAKSFLLSADMAHAVHPNYPSAHDAQHMPSINGGPVLKINANQRYATNGEGLTLIQQIAEHANVTLQPFVVRNDSSCGSTIGPMLSAHMGLRVLDLGNPQLSMHSIREMAGVEDLGLAISLFRTYFEKFSEVDGSINVKTY